jgi:hypothetical protein
MADSRSSIATKERRIRLAEKPSNAFLTLPGKASWPQTKRIWRGYSTVFRLEHLYRTEQFELPDAEDLEELRGLRKEFRGEKFESLLGLCRERGEEAMTSVLFPETITSVSLVATF